MQARRQAHNYISYTETVTAKGKRSNYGKADHVSRAANIRAHVMGNDTAGMTDRARTETPRGQTIRTTRIISALLAEAPLKLCNPLGT